MKPILIYSLLLLTHALSAQNDTWTYYSPPPQVSCLAASGNTILAGTAGAGILRFDTLDHRMYYHTGNSSIPTDTIIQVALDAKGHWWIQHRGGISTYDANTWQTWSITQTGLPANAIIRALKAAPDSSLYVATDHGVAIFKNASWVVLNNANSDLPSDNVWDVAFNPDGKVYFATSNAGLVVQDGSSWTSYTTANTGVQTMNNVYSVAYTADGVLWGIGGLSPTALLRLVKFEGGTWSGFTAVTIGITGGSILRNISASDDGALWLTTLSTVSVLANQVWTHYYHNADIGCSGIGTAPPAVAGDGHVWIQNSCQLAVFDGSDWYKPGTGLPGPDYGVFYNGIAEDATGGIWMGTEFGEYATRLQNNVWEQYYPTDLGASSNDIFVIQAAANGAVWFGLDHAEILKLENGAWSFFDTCAGVFNDHLTLSSATAPNGDQWFSFLSTANQPIKSGLARYSVNGTWQFYTPNDVPFLQYTYVSNIVFDVSGTAWISTSPKGLIKYDGTSWDTITTNNAALPSNRVFDLAFAPNGDLWVCTDEGLARFDGQSWTNITSTNSGLPSNRTYRIAFDKAGGMYVGYGSEVSGTPGATVAVLRHGVWSELTPPGWENTVNEEPDAFMVDSQNRLWFAELTAPGAYRYDPMLVNTTDPDEATLQIHLSPNPCQGNCMVTLETSIQPGMYLRVSNTLGQTVLDVPVNASSGTTMPIDVSRLQPGVYWVSLWQENKLQGRTSLIKI
jgi:sugar lactone lactonase YvrE